MSKNRYFKTKINYKSYNKCNLSEDQFEYQLKKALEDGNEKGVKKNGNKNNAKRRTNTRNT